MRRKCPVCERQVIAVSEILFSPANCPNCRSLVGVHWVASAGFAFLIFLTTSISTLIVLLESGLYAALLWFPFPIGALSYLKARFCPLEKKQVEPVPRSRPSTSGFDRDD